MSYSVESPQRMTLKSRLAFETDAAALWDTETEPLAQHQRRLLFHQLAHALVNGGPNRAPLPTELVRITLRLAGCMFPSAPYTLTTAPAPAPDYTCGGPLDDADAARAADVILRTPPLSAVFLTRAAQLRIAATERVCLWPEANASACAVHNFYFSVLLAEGPASALPRSEDGRALEWQCCVSVGPVKGSAARFVQFGPGHALWRCAREGDVIVVKAGPSIFNWRNDIAKAELCVWEFFDPTENTDGA